MTRTEYKKRIRAYLQSQRPTEEMWEYILESLMHVAETMGLDSVDAAIMTAAELSDHRKGK